MLIYLQLGCQNHIAMKFYFKSKYFSIMRMESISNFDQASMCSVNINGLVQDCSISSAKALEILQTYTKPSILSTFSAVCGWWYETCCCWHWWWHSGVQYCADMTPGIHWIMHIIELRQHTKSRDFYWDSIRQVIIRSQGDSQLYILMA